MEVLVVATFGVLFVVLCYRRKHLGGLFTKSTVLTVYCYRGHFAWLTTWILHWCFIIWEFFITTLRRDYHGEYLGGIIFLCSVGFMMDMPGFDCIRVRGCVLFGFSRWWVWFFCFVFFVSVLFSFWAYVPYSWSIVLLVGLYFCPSFSIILGWPNDWAAASSSFTLDRVVVPPFFPFSFIRFWFECYYIDF